MFKNPMPICPLLHPPPLYAGSLTIEKIRAKGLSWRDVFVEIPVTIHNSPLAVALMAEIEPPSTATQQDFDRSAGLGRWAVQLVGWVVSGAGRQQPGKG